jgi:uncharacterized protein (DUF924 family)
MTTAEDVLSFWFDTPATDADRLRVKMQRWFRGGPVMDQEIAARFTEVTERGLAGELDGWAADVRGRLALIILFDQFARNLWRDTPKAYAGDDKAQRLATEALDAGLDRTLSIEERNFLIMPLAHAENLAHQDRAAALMEGLVADAPADLAPVFSMGIEQTRKFRDIIARFGRFPHRNALFGRTSTPEELELLATWAAKGPPAAR